MFFLKKIEKLYFFSKVDDVLTIEILEHSVSDTLSRHSNQFNSIEKTEENSTPQIMKRSSVQVVNETSGDVSSDDDEVNKKVETGEKQQIAVLKRHSGTIGNTKFQFGSKGALPSPLGSAHSFDLQVRMK